MSLQAREHARLERPGGAHPRAHAPVKGGAHCPVLDALAPQPHERVRGRLEHDAELRQEELVAAQAAPAAVVQEADHCPEHVGVLQARPE